MSRALKEISGCRSKAAAQKKSLGSSERDEREREAFRERAGEVDPKMFVWVDESGTHTSMRRLRAPKGLPKGSGLTGACPETTARRTPPSSPP